MRYYVYISGAKLDMLAPQVPRRLWERLEPTLSIEAAGIKGSLAGARQPASMEANLNRVISHLEKLGVGSVEEPREYFKGVLSMKYMVVGNSMVLWGGAVAEDSLRVGLAGSSDHLQSSTYRSNGKALTGSLTHDILDNIGAYLEHSGVRSSPVKQRDVSAETALWHTWEAIKLMHEDRSLPPLRGYEFFAKRLLHGSLGGGELVLLGTPLYVALSD